MLVLRTPWIRELASWRSIMWRYNKQIRYDLKISQRSKRKDEEGKKRFPVPGNLAMLKFCQFFHFWHFSGFALIWICSELWRKKPKRSPFTRNVIKLYHPFSTLILFQNYSLAPPVLEQWYFTLSTIPIPVLPCRSASQKVVSKWLNRVMSWQSCNLPELEIIQPFALQQKPDRCWVESQHKPVSHQRWALKFVHMRSTMSSWYRNRNLVFIAGWEGISVWNLNIAIR